MDLFLFVEGLSRTIFVGLLHESESYSWSSGSYSESDV